ncbi:hypothetical protein [Phaeospirillum tilakii]|uniref:DUF2946 domain-containing protein n=1 Tax=Phaeospirillum tilakii TaxID=741673 RepID=A0ABW5C4P6_9PROT
MRTIRRAMFVLLGLLLLLAPVLALAGGGGTVVRAPALVACGGSHHSSAPAPATGAPLCAIDCVLAGLAGLIVPLTAPATLRPAAPSAVALHAPRSRVWPPAAPPPRLS